MSVLFPHWQERWFQQTDKDLQQRREGWLHGAAGLHLCGAPHPVLPEQVSGPVQCQTGHTAVVPRIQTPTGELTVTNERQTRNLLGYYKNTTSPPHNPAGRAQRQSDTSVSARCNINVCSRHNRLSWRSTLMLWDSS